MTDVLLYVPENVRYHLDGCELVVLESNHDLEMLKVGPYPWALKQRVMGRRGHSSNDSAAEFLLESLDAGGNARAGAFERAEQPSGELHGWWRSRPLNGGRCGRGWW